MLAGMNQTGKAICRTTAAWRLGVLFGGLALPIKQPIQKDRHGGARKNRADQNGRCGAPRIGTIMIGKHEHIRGNRQAAR